MSPAPRLTRHELRGLIKAGQWQRLQHRLARVPAQDVAAQLPSLTPQEQAALQALWSTDNNAWAAHSTKRG